MGYKNRLLVVIYNLYKILFSIDTLNPCENNVDMSR